MRLTPYERESRREIEKWQNGESSLVSRAINWAMTPMDWVVGQIVSGDLEEHADKAVNQFMSFLNDASHWTFDHDEIVAAAQEAGLEVNLIEDLRAQPLEDLDRLARSMFTTNAVMAAIEGGGFGLGGVVFIAADIPALFTINLRLIQQIAGAYGFDLEDPDYLPLVLSVFNVAASGRREARSDAMREVSVAAAAFANDLAYKGRVSGSFREQNRHLPREIAKNIVGRKLAQAIPIAGAAVGAGVNYWFTMETANAAYMLFRALYLERKERV